MQTNKNVSKLIQPVNSTPILIRPTLQPQKIIIQQRQKDQPKIIKVINNSVCSTKIIKTSQTIQPAVSAATTLVSLPSTATTFSLNTMPITHISKINTKQVTPTTINSTLTTTKPSTLSNTISDSNVQVTQSKPGYKVLKYPDGTTAQEYVIRAPKTKQKKLSVMKFEYTGNLDFNRLGDAIIQRENNYKSYRQANDIDQAPKFGEGSEYRKDEKDEARRKKYGIRKKIYNPEDQPWLLNVGGKERQKKFKGNRAGGASDNASYYVFMQCPDGAFEAFPISDWHIFKPYARYNHLTAEEAEEEFLNRDKRLNRASVKIIRQLRGKIDDEDVVDTGKKKKDLLLTEADEWGAMSDKDSGDNNDENGEDKLTTSKKKSKVKGNKKFQRQNSEDEAMEDSDDGDKEDKEFDYMTESDSDDDDMYKDQRGKETASKYEEEGVADEDGLKNLLNSEDEEEEEKQEEDEENEDDKKKKSKAEKKKKDVGEEELMSESSTSSDSSDESSDSDPEVTSPFLLNKKKKTPPPPIKSETPTITSIETVSASSTTTSISTKRKADEPANSAQIAKKQRTERIINHVVEKSFSNSTATSTSSTSTFGTSIIGKGDGTLNEENVRRYLMRKPITTTDLLKKFKSKNPSVSKNEIAMALASILKKIKPEQKKINDVLHLSLMTSTTKE